MHAEPASTPDRRGIGFLGRVAYWCPPAGTRGRSATEQSVSKRVSVVVRPGDEPVSVQRLERLASALLTLNRCRPVDTHCGSDWTGYWDNWWFDEWGPAPDYVEPQPVSQTEWQPCPACQGAGATCEFCLGQPWRENWDILRRIARMPIFIDALRAGRLRWPRYFVTPDGRVRAGDQTNLDELASVFEDCWVVSARCFF